jgi:hypothetical protein
MNSSRLKELAGIISEDAILDKDGFISKHKFRLIGTYDQGPDGESKRSSVVKISERKNIVYCMFIGEDLMYVGKTVRGVSRPLTYHKNPKMLNVKDGIKNANSQNIRVEVYAKFEGLELEHEGLKMNIIEAFEQAIITKYNPEWNKFKQS